MQILSNEYQKLCHTENAGHLTLNLLGLICIVQIFEFFCNYRSTTDGSCSQQPGERKISKRSLPRETMIQNGTNQRTSVQRLPIGFEVTPQCHAMLAFPCQSMPVHTSLLCVAALLFFLRLPCMGAFCTCLPAFRAKQGSAVLSSFHLFHTVSYSSLKKNTAPTALMFSSHLVRWRALARSLLCFWLVLGLSHDWGKSLQHVHNPILAPKVLSMPAGTQRIEW